MLKEIFMKKVSAILLIFLLFGCEMQYEDAIPEGSFLGTPRLAVNLNEEGRIILNWNISRFCAGWNCDPVVEGSSYDIFAKLPEESDFVRIERVGKDENEFMVPNTEFSKPYEFYVSSNRAGQVAKSNTVMIIPNPYPVLEAIIENEDWNVIKSPKINIQGNKLVYISNYLWTESGQEYGIESLFLKDLITGEMEMIRKGSYHPKWSRDGNQLVYGTTDGLSQIAQGYTPIQIESYNVDTKEITLLKGGLHQHYFPSFAKDNESILFLSDSLEREEFGLWKRNNEGNSEELLPQILQNSQLSEFAYFVNMDVSSFSDLVSLDVVQEVESRQVYNIYRVDLNNGPKISDLVVSPWNDTSSSFSPFKENLFAFVSDRSGSRQVWVLDISIGKLNQVSYLKEDLFISTNGNIISWVDQGQSLAFPVSNSTGIQKLIKIQIPN